MKILSQISLSVVAVGIAILCFSIPATASSQNDTVLQKLFKHREVSEQDREEFGSLEGLDLFLATRAHLRLLAAKTRLRTALKMVGQIQDEFALLSSESQENDSDDSYLLLVKMHLDEVEQRAILARLNLTDRTFEYEKIFGTAPASEFNLRLPALPVTVLDELEEDLGLQLVSVRDDQHASENLEVILQFALLDILTERQELKLQQSNIAHEIYRARKKLQLAGRDTRFHVARALGLLLLRDFETFKVEIESLITGFDILHRTGRLTPEIIIKTLRRQQVDPLSDLRPNSEKE